VYDVIIAGGGPAGLSAALILGRCRRKVLLCDTGRPRNAASQALNGYLSRDGMPPAEFLEAARRDLDRYGIECRTAAISAARCLHPGFEVTLEGAGVLSSHLLLVATGVVDDVPDVPGFAAFYGRGVFHCPYCDGWEVRDQPLAVYGKGRSGCGLALSLTTWSADVILCTNGPATLLAHERRDLAACAVAVRQEKIERLEGAGRLEGIRFATGETLARHALFFASTPKQHCELARNLGCQFTRKGAVRTNRREGTNVDGLFVAGDASHDVQFVIVAAAEGAKAAVAMNKQLQRRDAEARRRFPTQRVK
jgi:thioredoxin reductase